MSTYIPRAYSQLKLKNKLNSGEPVQSPNSLEPENKTPLDFIVEAYEQLKNPRVITKNPGPYKSIVFKGVADDNRRVITDADSSNGLLFGKDTYGRIRCIDADLTIHKVRPEKFDGCSQRIAFLYKEHVSSTANEPPPTPGQIVWTNNLDRLNFEDPIYYSTYSTTPLELDGANGSIAGTSTTSPVSTGTTVNGAGRKAIDVAKEATAADAGVNGMTYPWEQPVQKFTCDPLEAIGINSSYGLRSLGVNSARGHMGTDFYTSTATAGGTKVYAVEDGVATHYASISCGWMINLKTKNGYSVDYCHLGIAIDPANGLEAIIGKSFNVTAGDWIGIASNSGVPSYTDANGNERQAGNAGQGAHLHFETEGKIEIIDKNGKKSNPSKFIPTERLVPTLENYQYAADKAPKTILSASTLSKLKTNQNQDKYAAALAIAQKRELERDQSLYAAAGRDKRENPADPSYDPVFAAKLKRDREEQRKKEAQAKAEEQRKKAAAKSTEKKSKNQSAKTFEQLRQNSPGGTDTSKASAK